MPDRGLFSLLYRLCYNSCIGTNLRDTARRHSTTMTTLLLEYGVDQGLDPLCEFLGKEIPECEFPAAIAGINSGPAAALSMSML